MSLVPTDVSIENQSDSDLIHLCLQGHRQSFRYLYRRYEPKVRSTLYQLCGTSALDDLVQEVFLRVWKHLPQLRQPKQFSTWLYRISWNVAADRRREFAQQRGFDSKLKTIPEIVLPEEAKIFPSSDLMQLHYQDLVQRGLNSLSFEHRSVLVLHDLEDVPQKEIAEILGIPVGTVKSRLFHARAAMRQFLQQEGVQL